MIAVFKLQTMCYEDCFRHDPRTFAPPHSPTHMMFFSPRRHTLKWENLANRFQSIFRVGRQWTWSSRTLALSLVFPVALWFQLELGFGLVIMGEVHKSWVRLICFFLRKGCAKQGVGRGLNRIGWGSVWNGVTFSLKLPGCVELRSYKY